jgi:peptidyl-prolyl cis-trans isomerase B (cyclophilin B)
VASSRDRQRKLAREKIDRQMARRAGQERRRRRIQAGIGAAVAVLLIVAGVAWLGGAFDSDDPADTAEADTCVWTSQNAETNTNLKDVGEPPTTGMPTTGTRPMTITTDQGKPIGVTLDVSAAPCSAASLYWLADKKFFDNTECHEITTEGALRCGDPSGTGQGGPTYTVFDENVPSGPGIGPSGAPGPKPGGPLYPKGTVALIGNPPGNNGSQFLLFFKDFTTDNPQYPIVGKITDGMDTLTKIGKIPTVDNGSGSKVKPKTKVVVQSVTLGAPVTDTAPAPTSSSQS